MFHRGTPASDSRSPSTKKEKESGALGIHGVAGFVWIALRFATIAFAVLIALFGLLTAVDPGALDSEPQPHAPGERTLGMGLMVLAMLWFVSPRVLARSRLRSVATVLLVVLPLGLVVLHGFLRVPRGLDPVVFVVLAFPSGLAMSGMFLSRFIDEWGEK